MRPSPAWLRAVVVKKLKALPIEAIVRGYLVGSGWKEYKAKGTVCGIKLPAGLQEASKLPAPIFTPSSKAAVGEHDENISIAQVEALIGKEMADQVAKVAIQLYTKPLNMRSPMALLLPIPNLNLG